MLNKKKLLFITNLLPFPPDNGGKIKTLNTLDLLRDKYDITLYAFIESEEERRNIVDIKDYVCSVEVVVKKIRLHNNRFMQFLLAFSSLFSSKPYLIYKYYSPKMKEVIRKAILSNKYDIVYIDHLQLFQYIPKEFLKIKAEKIVLDEHNVELEIVRRYLDQEKNLITKLFLLLEYIKLRNYEINACLMSGIVFAITDHDKNKLILLSGRDTGIYTAPYFVHSKSATELHKPNSTSKKIIFIGTMSWHANEDAVLWFHKEVFTAYSLADKGWSFWIIGNSPGDNVSRLRSYANTYVTGYVDDIKPFIWDCALAVVPIRMGGGLRIKILELLSFGVPVITTTIGCEGIQVEDGKNIIIADNPGQFTEKISLLHDDLALRNNISKEAVMFIEGQYSFNNAKKQYLSRLD